MQSITTRFAVFTGDEVTEILYGKSMQTHAPSFSESCFLITVLWNFSMVSLLFIKKVLFGKCTGVSFVDSTPLRVCKNQRIHMHKVFKGIYFAIHNANII